MLGLRESEDSGDPCCNRYGDILRSKQLMAAEIPSTPNAQTKSGGEEM